VIDDLQPERVRQRVTGNWGRSLTVRESTASTMDDASAAAAEGANDGHVVLADQQTRGRGAHGRQWLSPPGSDLYFSVVTRPAIEPASTALITLATGLGVRDAVAALLPDRSVLVKWPNDIWIERRKCAGVLVESRTVGMRMDSVVIGVGLNVNRLHWPPELTGAATSLRAERSEAEPFDRADVLAALLSHMEQWANRFVKDGAPVVVDALRPRLALVGERVRWEDGEGVFDGIDPDGAARVRTDAGVVSLHAAHIEPVDR
jgi:BirA family biotin operon repressor/biotin-[acetyl-CoA-carboxylase] ligase